MNPRRWLLCIALLLAAVSAWFATRSPATDAASLANRLIDSTSNDDRGAQHELPAIEADVAPRSESPDEPPLPSTTSASSRQIEVHITDEDSKPFFGIEVDLVLLDADGGRIGFFGDEITAADGLCTLAWGADPAANRARELQIRFDEPYGYADFDVRVPVERERVDVQLALGSHVFGSVRYPDGPLAGRFARVAAHWRIDAERAGVAEAGVALGQYDLDREVAGSIERIELENLHTSPTFLDYSARGGLPVPAGEDFWLDLVFEPDASSVELVFLDALSREPVTGMWAFGLDGLGASDEHGRLHLAHFLGPKSSTRLRFNDSNERYAPVRVQLDGPDPVRSFMQEVLVERALSLSGIVTDLRGLPQPALTVRCERAVRPTAAHGSVLHDLRIESPTDRSGYFAIHGLPPRGELQVSFVRRDKGLGLEYVAGFEVVSMPEAAAREKWLVPDLVTIVGSVVDPDGRPVAGARVMASGTAVSAWHTVETDAQGQFHIDDALPGAWSIAVDFGEPRAFGARALQARQRVARNIDVGTAGTARVDLRQPAPLTEWPFRAVRLQFIDSRTHATLDKVEFVQWAGIDHSLTLVHSDPDLVGGAFVQVMPTGRIEVIVQTPDYATARQFVDVVEGEGVDEQHVVVALVPLE